MSRLHAWIRAAPNGYEIEDAGSANGTWLNDTCLEGATPLSEGDVIRIGPCSFVFYGSSHASSSAAGSHQALLPPGSMTVVSDVGHDPNPFGGESLLPEDSLSSRSPTPSFISSAWPAATANPARPPEQAAPPARPPDPQPVPALRAQLGDLNRDLGAYLQRLDTLSASLASLEGQLGDSRSAAPGPRSGPLQKLRAALAAAGEPDQYRELQALLEELRPTPTDLRLLLRLSEQLPLISTLVQAYLRAATLLHELDGGERPRNG